MVGCQEVASNEHTFVSIYRDKKNRKQVHAPRNYNNNESRYLIYDVLQNGEIFGHGYLSPVHTSYNVEAILSNATKSNVASTKSNVASILLPFCGNTVEATFDFVAKNGKNVERVLR